MTKADATTVTAGIGLETEASIAGVKKTLSEWTIMIYMAGDNDLTDHNM